MRTERDDSPCPAAHERAVVTVRLTLLLLIVGAALFLFTGTGGVHPATGFLEGVTLNEDGGVVVDAHMRAADSLYAAGDIANFPDPRTGERVRIEHWRTAQQQGRVAAHNMAGRRTAFDGVPFFWTHQFDTGLLYVGHASRWDEVIYSGDVAAQDFIAFYVKDGRALAGFQLGYVFTCASATPFNVLTGNDRNADTNFNDRPAGVGRNTGRGFGFASLDLRLGRRFRLTERVELETMVEGFNVLNRANYQAPNNVFGTGATPPPSFGLPTAAADPRQVQLGLRLTF